MNNNNFDPMTGQPIQMQQSVSNTSTKKDIKKLLLIILVIILIVGIVVFVYFRFFASNNKTTADLNTIFDPDKPIVVKNNDKYGYITSDGKIMLEPKYISAKEFYGDYAVVVIDSSDTDAYKDSTYQIIDKKGNVKLVSEDYSEPQYYPDYEVWLIDRVLYDSSLNRMFSGETTVEYIDYGYFKYQDSEKNECGIVKYDGKKIFTMPGTYIYTRISENEYNEDDLYASVKGDSGSEKEFIISLKTGDVLFTSEDANSYYIVKEENGIFYYYKHTVDDGYDNKKYLFFIDNKLAYTTTEKVHNVEVYDYKNQILEIDYGYDYETVGKKDRTYYYDVKNKKMLEELSSSISITDAKLDLAEKTYGFKKFSCSGKVGLMSGEKVIIPCEYNSIIFLDINVFNYLKSKDKEIVILIKDKNLVLYNIKDSKIITTINSNYAFDYSYSTFIKVNLYDEDGYSIKGYKIYNLLSDKSMDVGRYDDVSIGSNYVAIKENGKKTYYNTNFEKIYVEE